jgi:polysaccharide chain length determinant protein (PEP-CTERM system associated)
MAAMQKNPLLKEYLDIAFRRKWWIILPALVGLLFSIAVYFQFPKKYMAETRVQIREQTISRSLMEPILDFSSTDLVTQIRAEVTAEQYVKQVDDELQLVGSEGGPSSLTQLAKQLERNITLDTNPRERYFTLQVSWNDPRLAAAIANKMASIYIERNAKIRADMAGRTLQQLRDKRLEIERRLQAIRDTISEFRSEHKFELESYADTNQGQIDQINSEVDRIDQRIREYKNEVSRLELDLDAALSGDADAGPGRDPRRDRLESLRQDLAELRSQGKTDRHPRVQQLQNQIAGLEQELQAAGLGEQPEESRESYQVRSMRQEIQRYENEIEALEQDRAELRAEASTIQERLRLTPDRQNQLERYLQQESNLQQLYDDAYNKEMEALEGKQIEEFQAGERFEVLNMARAPAEPFFPDLRLFIFMGLSVGVGLGVALVLLLEVFDQSFKSEEQLASAIDLPILAVIPDLEKAVERTNRRRGKTRVVRGGAS